MIAAFIILGAVFVVTHGIPASPNPFASLASFFPKGIQGTLQSMLIIIFTYGGVSAIAMASSEVSDPQKEIPKATILVTLGGERNDLEWKAHAQFKMLCQQKTRFIMKRVF